MTTPRKRLRMSKFATLLATLLTSFMLLGGSLAPAASAAPADTDPVLTFGYTGSTGALVVDPAYVGTQQSVKLRISAYDASNQRIYSKAFFIALPVAQEQQQMNLRDYTDQVVAATGNASYQLPPNTMIARMDVTVFPCAKADGCSVPLAASYGTLMDDPRNPIVTLYQQAETTTTFKLADELASVPADQVLDTLPAAPAVQLSMTTGRGVAGTFVAEATPEQTVVPHAARNTDGSIARYQMQNQYNKFHPVGTPHPAYVMTGTVTTADSPWTISSVTGNDVDGWQANLALADATHTFVAGAHGAIAGNATVTVPAAQPVGTVANVAPEAGYMLEGWIIDGDSSKVYTSAQLAELRFYQAHEFTAQFVEIPARPLELRTLDPNGVVNTDVTYSLTDAAGVEVAGTVVDGVWASDQGVAEGSYTLRIGNIPADMTLAAGATRGVLVTEVAGQPGVYSMTVAKPTADLLDAPNSVSFGLDPVATADPTTATPTPAAANPPAKKKPASLPRTGAAGAGMAVAALALLGGAGAVARRRG